MAFGDPRRYPIARLECEVGVDFLFRHSGQSWLGSQGKTVLLNDHQLPFQILAIASRERVVGSESRRETDEAGNDDQHAGIKGT